MASSLFCLEVYVHKVEKLAKRLRSSPPALAVRFLSVLVFLDSDAFFEASSSVPRVLLFLLVVNFDLLLDEIVVDLVLLLLCQRRRHRPRDAARPAASSSQLANLQKETPKQRASLVARARG
jgi:hypothetical protein